MNLRGYPFRAALCLLLCAAFCAFPCAADGEDGTAEKSAFAEYISAVWLVSGDADARENALGNLGFTPCGVSGGVTLGSGRTTDPSAAVTAAVTFAFDGVPTDEDAAAACGDGFLLAGGLVCGGEGREDVCTLSPVSIGTGNGNNSALWLAFSRDADYGAPLTSVTLDGSEVKFSRAENVDYTMQTYVRKIFFIRSASDSAQDAEAAAALAARLGMTGAGQAAANDGRFVFPFCLTCCDPAQALCGVGFIRLQAGAAAVNPAEEPDGTVSAPLGGMILSSDGEKISAEFSSAFPLTDADGEPLLLRSFRRAVQPSGGEGVMAEFALAASAAPGWKNAGGEGDPPPLPAADGGTVLAVFRSLPASTAGAVITTAWLWTSCLLMLAVAAVSVFLILRFRVRRKNGGADSAL